MKKNIKIIVPAILLVALSIMLVIGLKRPPERISSSDIQPIYEVSTSKLSNDEILYWESLYFELCKSEYPGETPDYRIDLTGTSCKYSAMYNKQDTIVYFSFGPEIKYGFLTSPPPGGWTVPLYKTEATDEILRLLRIKTVEKLSHHSSSMNNNYADSLILIFWNSHNACEYIYKWKNNTLRISNECKPEENEITNNETLAEISNNVGDFFITKTKPIELNRNKKDRVEATDYSELKVKIYQDENKLTEFSIQLGNEDYDNEFNKEFLEFINLLIALAE